MKGISCGCCDIWKFILGFKQFSAFASLSHFYWPRSVACRRSSSLCPSDSRRTSSPSALFGVSWFTTLCHREGGIRNARDHFHIAGPLAAISFCLPRLPLKHFLLFWGRSNSYLLLFCSVLFRALGFGSGIVLRRGFCYSSLSWSILPMVLAIYDECTVEDEYICGG